MEIKRLKVSNYRSLQQFDITLDSSYSVISGKNNSGKSCVLKLISAIIGEGKSDYFSPRRRDTISWADDATLWDRSPETKISALLEIAIDEKKDPALFEFIRRIAKIELNAKERISISVEVSSDDSVREKIILRSKDKLDDYASTEIIRWIRERGFIIFHDSTSSGPYRSYWRSNSELFSLSLSSPERQKVEDLNKRFSSVMKQVSKARKMEVEKLLGTVGEKYFVELDYPKLSLDDLPFEITLSERKGHDISLSNWGSGTRNRTLILTSLLRAKQISEDTNSSTRIRPIVIIEEPEAFLHPSAQSNFGRVLEELSSEFDLQVIVSSHSPFLLSRSQSNSNYLIDRSVKYGKNYETILIDTAGDNWMKPFSTCLGMTSEDLEPWHDVIKAGGGNILVVEGDLDREFLEVFCKKTKYKIDSIEIKPIGGKDKLGDKGMVKFIHKFVERVVFLLDLDAQHLESGFSALSLVKGRDYIWAGKDAGGQRRIEGLLPEELTKEVYADNVHLVNQLQSNKSDEKKSAASRLKRKMVDHFSIWLDEGKDAPEFGKLVNQVNRAFSQT